MNTLSVTYTYKYVIDFAPNYKFTTCGVCINAKTRRKIKKVYNSGSIGYNIRGKFYSLKRLRSHLIKELHSNCPF